MTDATAPADTAANGQTEPMEGQAPVSGRTSDLGANGISINVPDPLLVGQTGQISFDLLVEGRQVAISARAKALYMLSAI